MGLETKSKGKCQVSNKTESCITRLNIYIDRALLISLKHKNAKLVKFTLHGMSVLSSDLYSFRIYHV